jgi:phage shock protein A
MPDSVFVRIERIVRTSADRALQLAEQASGVVLVREAARELERAEEQLLADRKAADAKRERAVEAQAAARAKIAELGDHASYALGKGRDDLARAAVARQVDLEGEIKSWGAVADEAKVEAKYIDEVIAEVGVRRKRIQEELAALEREQSGVKVSTPAGRTKSRAAEAVDRADRMFERVMTERNPAAETGEAVKPIADIVAMRRDDEIEARLAALKSSAKAEKAKARKAR